MKRKLMLGLSIFSLLGAIFGLAWSHNQPGNVALSSGSVSTHATISEAPSFEASAHPVYWLNSGGEARIKDGAITTLIGELTSASPWYGAYRSSNPADTDQGRHPQNIFRLLTKETYADHEIEATVTIHKTILSESDNRNETNGMLLMLRYQDQNNLYYAGLRVDGQAVIKKKLGGTYHTLALIPVFSYIPYDKAKFPNLIPSGVPIALKAEILDVAPKQVLIALSIDIGKSGAWIPILSFTDVESPANPIIDSPGHAGFRSDFLEATIKDFKVEKI